MNGNLRMPDRRLAVRRAMTALMLLAVAAACRKAEPPARQPVVVRNADYLVLRSLTREEDAEHKTRVQMPYSGAGYAFAAATPLVDLNGFVLADAHLADGGADLAGGVAILMPLTPEGSRALEAWSTQHTGELLGVFLKGKLVDAPRVQSRISGVIPLRVASQAEAQSVLKELAKGGKSE
jgi:preprotein translocase subunit SecD